MNNLMENFSGLAMSRMEMKKVTGGFMAFCQCTKHVGTWYGKYSSQSALNTAQSNYCRGGSICTVKK